MLELRLQPVWYAFLATSTFMFIPAQTANGHSARFLAALQPLSATSFTLPPPVQRQLQDCAELRLPVGAGMSRCRLFIPRLERTRRRFPLVVFLHGGAGRGRDNERQLREGNGMLINLFVAVDAQKRFPSFVLAPQTEHQHDADAVLALVHAVSEVRDETPFAAAVLIASGSVPDVLPHLTRLPIWFFHGEKDK